jgi:4'-phosphopantetheinyl transferase
MTRKGNVVLGPEEVHVWRFDLDRPAGQLAELARLLTPDERARAARLRYDRLRARFTAARGLLRTLLGRYQDCRPEAIVFAYGPNGKPSLAGPGGAAALEFNLSHSEGRALFAAARQPVGTDLEVLRNRIDAEGVAASFFAPEELAALRAAPPQDRLRQFFITWVRKEAFMKATGRGFAEDPRAFSVTAVGGDPALRLLVPGRPEEAARWSIHDLPVGPDIAAALAVAAEDWRLVCRDLDDAPWPGAG